jgi:hypothetical protein
LKTKKSWDKNFNHALHFKAASSRALSTFTHSCIQLIRPIHQAPCDNSHFAEC